MEFNGQPHALAALSPGKDHMVPTEWEAGWASDLVWTFWEFETLDCAVGSLFAIPTVLSRFHTLCSSDTNVRSQCCGYDKAFIIIEELIHSCGIKIEEMAPEVNKMR